jgi:hypothetical protein
MRRTLVLFGLALAAAGPALAQSNRGALGLDARFAPTTSLGVSYYVTDGLSLRPWLGLGYSEFSGFYASVGGQLRYELRAQPRLSPYVSAIALYSHFGNDGSTPTLVVRNAASQPLVLANDLGQFGAGVGLRLRLTRNVALFAEGSALRTTSAMGSLGTGWSTIGINDRTRVDVILGLTYLFR